MAADTPEWLANYQHEVSGIAACLAEAHARTERLRRILRPGLEDAVVSNLHSDLTSADTRIAWLRERVEEYRDLGRQEEAP